MITNKVRKIMYFENDADFEQFAIVPELVTKYTQDKDPYSEVEFTSDFIKAQNAGIKFVINDPKSLICKRQFISYKTTGKPVNVECYDFTLHGIISKPTGRNSILDNYIKECNDLADAWIYNPKEVMSNHICNKQKLPKTEFNEAGMPEPYLGNPYDCSAVIININPGGINSYNSLNPDKDTIIIDEEKSDNFIYKYYSDDGFYYDVFAKDFPYLTMKNIPKKDRKYGFNWWKKRQEWIGRFFPQGEGIPLPFALEICPWHSSTWHGMNFGNDELKCYIRDFVIAPACEAIKLNRLPYGLIVGKAVCDAIRKSDSSWCWEEKGWNRNSGIKWPKRERDKQLIDRTYKVLTNGQIRFLCTWWSGGNNNVPKFEDFHEIEEMIKNSL